MCNSIRTDITFKTLFLRSKSTETMYQIIVEGIPEVRVKILTKKTNILV
jgi:hypothetical protein